MCRERWQEVVDVERCERAPNSNAQECYVHAHAGALVWCVSELDTRIGSRIERVIGSSSEGGVWWLWEYVIHCARSAIITLIYLAYLLIGSWHRLWKKSRSGARITHTDTELVHTRATRGSRVGFSYGNIKEKKNVLLYLVHRWKRDLTNIIFEHTHCVQYCVDFFFKNFQLQNMERDG